MSSDGARSPVKRSTAARIAPTSAVALRSPAPFSVASRRAGPNCFQLFHLFHLFPAFALRLGDPIGIQHQHALRRQLHLAAGERQALHHPGHRVARRRHELERAAAERERRRVVSRAHVGERSGRGVEQGAEEAHEERLLVPLHEQTVHALDDALDVGALRARPAGRLAAEHGQRAHHEERGRQSLAADVADRHEEPGRVDEECVVEVAAHLARREEARGAVHLLAVGKQGRLLRQHPGLDVAREAEVALQMREVELRADLLDDARTGAPHPVGQDPHEVAAHGRDRE